MREQAIYNPKAFITDFFRRCGIGQAKNEQHFWKQLDRLYGPMANRFYEIMNSRADGNKVDIYSVKNHSMEFANSIISQFDSARLREIGIWLIQENLAPKCILEIGCDSGLISCFLANLYPETSVVGIDPCPEAVELARSRADKLGLTNVRFESSDLGKFTQQYEGQSFDLVIASVVFHEVLEQIPELHSIQHESKQTSHFSIAEFDSWISGRLRPAAPIAGVVQHLALGARFISVDRWETCERLLTWIRLAEMSGLAICLNESNIIRFKDEGTRNKSENFPLTVFYPGKGRNPQAEEILSLYGFKAFLNHFPKEVSDWSIAEMLFASLDPKEIAVTIRATYRDGSEVHLFQVGAAKAIGFIYQTSSGGYRKLTLMPVCCLPEILPTFEEIETNLSSQAEVVINWNSSSTLFHRLGK